MSCHSEFISESHEKLKQHFDKLSVTVQFDKTDDPFLSNSKDRQFWLLVDRRKS